MLGHGSHVNGGDRVDVNPHNRIESATSAVVVSTGNWCGGTARAAAIVIILSHNNGYGRTSELSVSPIGMRITAPRSPAVFVLGESARVVPSSTHGSEF